MHILIHAIINLIFGFSISLKSPYLIALVIGGVLIDIDHIIYMISRGIYTPKKMFAFHNRESKIMRPHFYFMHFIEPIIILMLLFYFINSIIFYLFSGFLLHWICDTIAYLHFYKTAKPWIHYYSLIGFLVRPTNLKTS